MHNTVPEATESWWVGYAFTINSIVGSGILAIPWAYSQGGWLFSISIQVLSTIFSAFVSYQTLQTWSRVEIIARLQEKNIEVRPVPFRAILLNTQGNYIEESEEKNSFLKNESDFQPEISTRKFDFYEMTN